MKSDGLRWTGEGVPQVAVFTEVLTDLGLTSNDEGFEVHLTRGGPGLTVTIGTQGASIEFQDNNHLYRALGHLAAHLGEPGWHLTETRAFTSLGAMTDASRNAVATVTTLKTFLRTLAVMGFNQLMIYMEDTFEIPEYPYFGYQRGRYTQAELKELDNYAFALGIELVPCIQTLAHLPRFLHWRNTAPLRDTFDVLLAGSDETYRFLDAMIRAVAVPLRSRKIHLGMDEAFEVGLGKYLALHGPRNRYEILTEHLSRVVGICTTHGLKPLMWSDMFFRLADPSGDYAAENIPAGVAKAIPPEVQLVYWDYFSMDKSFYRRKMQQHEDMKPGTMFAGGIWTFNGTAVAYNKTFITTLPALEACKEADIQDVLATLWGDDGSEAHFCQALYGLQLYAEISFGLTGDTLETFDFPTVDRRFRECTGGNPDAFRALDLVDNVQDQPRNLRGYNTSKQAFYQDPLLGLFDRHLEGLVLNSRFEKLAGRFEVWAQEPNRWAPLFEPVARYCSVLALKAEMGIKLKALYDAKDLAGLGRFVPQIRETADRIGELHRVVRNLYDRDFKPFGGEVTDLRLGGLKARLIQTANRIEALVAGQILSIAELEADRLWYDGRTEPGDQQELRFNRWHQIVTPGYISHNVQ